jgi:hypothetical protein
MEEIDDEDEDGEAYWERFDKEAQSVYEIWWKQSRKNAPDDELCVEVFLFDNQYFVHIGEGEFQRPYATLEAAILAEELNDVYEHTFEINAPTLSDEYLQGLLYYAGTLKHTLIVNGKKWRAKAGRKLEPVLEGDLSK